MADLRSKFIEDYAGGLLNVSRQELASTGEVLSQDGLLSDATLYLEYFSLVILGWQWLLQGQKASAGLATAATEEEKHFYEGKLLTLRYFMEYEIPKTRGMKERLFSEERVTMETRAEHLA